MKTAGNRLAMAAATVALLLVVAAGGRVVFANTLVSGETDGGVTYTRGDDGAIAMRFPAQRVSSTRPPQYVAGMVVANGGAFEGDYRAAGVTGLTFRVMSDGHMPGGAQVVLEGRQSRRIWVSDNVNMSDVADVWTTSYVVFNRVEGGWKRGGTDLDAKWEEDIRDVGLLGIRISQGGIEEQTYTIAGFELVDSSGQPGGEAELTPLERALLERFGVIRPEDVSAEARLESDPARYGLTDFLAILMTFDETIGEALFFAEILAVGNEGVYVRWPAIQGWSHTVLRADSLLDGFDYLPDDAGANLIPDKTGFMTFLDTSAAGLPGPLFYRIVRRPVNP